MNVTVTFEEFASIVAGYSAVVGCVVTLIVVVVIQAACDGTKLALRLYHGSQTAGTAGVPRDAGEAPLCNTGAKLPFERSEVSP